MNRIHVTGLAALAALALGAGSALAQPAKGNNVAENAQPDEALVSAIQSMAMAQQLASIGVESGDPILLIAAARLASQVAASETTLQPREPERPGDGEVTVLHSAEEMLAAARDLAGDRQDLIGLIDDVAAEGSRGSIYGAGYYDGYVDGYQNVYYDEAFYGGEQAIVTLQGHNPSDIDLWVYDEYGNLICSSTGYSSYETCSWTPAWTGNFTIRVENEGHARGTYYTLWTN